MAPLYLFSNGPAANTFNSGRFGYYGVTGTPTVKFDGAAASYAPGNYATYIANRLAVPCYASIDVNMVGNASGGTAYVSITAEQDLGISGQIKVWTVITEDNDVAGTGWGGYTGQKMMWLPVAWALGAQGTVVNFTGPYPQTVSVAGNYTLNPVAHTFDNLNVVTFVQVTTTREVLNASITDLPDTATGIEDIEGLGSVDLSVWPNPSAGMVSVGTIVPDGTTGSVEIYSLTGRVVSSFDASAVTPVSIEEPGVYFVVLQTTDGAVLTDRFTVVR